jgi:hypothetical protein
MSVTNPPVQGVYQTIYTATSDQVVANTAAEQSLLPASARTLDGGLLLPANSVWDGVTITGVVRGLYSTRVLAPGTCMIRLKVGGVTVATANLDNLLLNLSQRALSISFTLTFRTKTSVTAAGQVQLAGASRIPQLYELTAAADATVDTTQALQIGLTTQWASADAANVMLVRTAVLQKLMP